MLTRHDWSVTTTQPLIEAADSVPEGDLDPAPDSAPDLPEGRFGNRELSWLAFNERVLALAENDAQPLLERVKYLAIFASNLDEFYMVRVAGLKRRADMGLQVPSADGLSPREVLAALASQIGKVVDRHARCYSDVIAPALDAEGIHVRRWDDLDDEEQGRLGEYFRSKIFPVLTPLAVDPAHPFPYISGQSLNLAVLVRETDGGAQRFARVKVPNNVPALRRGVAVSGRDRVPADRGPHRRAPVDAVPGHGRSSSTTCSGSPATRTSRWRRTATRICCRRSSAS